MNETDGGYITLNEREAYREGRIRAHDTRRLYGLQGVMRNVRSAVAQTRMAQASTLLGAESQGARWWAAFTAGTVDAALAIVQRVR